MDRSGRTFRAWAIGLIALAPAWAYLAFRLWVAFIKFAVAF